MPAATRTWVESNPADAARRVAVRDGAVAEAEAELECALDDVDRYIVAFSGGKDSIALVIRLLELGVPRERIELWHHLVDGQGARFFDWPSTLAYCRAFADAFNLPLYCSWRIGGFLREMLRNDTPTAPVKFETPSGPDMVAGGAGPGGTRLRFPQVTSDLTVRWCSSYLKIDVAARVFTNDARFDAGRFVLLTGERAEESAARARYSRTKPHGATTRTRIVTQWRAVHGWTEAQVWAAMQRWRVNPHPAYRLGFGRLSCMTCIFGNDDQWATVAQLSPDILYLIASYEESFNATIDRKHEGVLVRANRGTSMIPPGLDDLAKASQEETFEEPIFVDDWQLPAGAFKHTGGPT